MKVRFKPLSSNFKLPKKGSATASCYDCVATSVEHLGDNLFEYGLGFSTEFSEPGWKGVVVPRSSFTKSDFVMQNSPAQIDEDYRGEWRVRFRFVGDPKYIIQKPYNVGDRICQIYFEKVNEISMEVVDELTETERNEGGFGSTGK